MPKWGPPPEKVIQDSLTQVLSDIEQEVVDHPSFEHVAGIPLQQLVDHASTAIAAFAMRNPESGVDKTELLQVYCLGFVVGTRYGERHSGHSPDEDRSHERKDDGDIEEGGV